MASLNKVFLIGNLTREPALRFTPGGAAVCEFGIAVNRRFTSANGQEKKEETCFVEIIVWGKQAEQCDRSLEKGAPVFIEGRLQYDQWEERETGAKRSRLRVQAERVQFIAGRGAGRDMDDEGGGDYAQQERQQRPYGGQQQQRGGGSYQSGGGGSYRGSQQGERQQSGERQQRPFPSDNRQERQQQPSYDEPPKMPEEAFRDEEPEDDIPF